MEGFVEGGLAILAARGRWQAVGVGPALPVTINHMPHGDATLAVSSLGVILLLAGNAFAIVRGHYAPSLTSLTLVSAITLELCGPQSGGWLTQSHWSRMEVVMAVNAIFI